MTHHIGVACGHPLAARWQTLAEQRLEYLTELFETGRWRRYHSEIAFLEMPGIGVNRTWWPGGRYAYVSAHFDGFTDHCLCIVDLNEVTKPVITSKWWLPGMNRAAGETLTSAKAGQRITGYPALVDKGEMGVGELRRRHSHPLSSSARLDRS